jgi:hypothetical protein
MRPANFPRVDSSLKLRGGKYKLTSGAARIRIKLRKSDKRPLKSNSKII